MASIHGTMMPFLYPCLRTMRSGNITAAGSLRKLFPSHQGASRHAASFFTGSRKAHPQTSEEDLPPLPDVVSSRSLDPEPSDFSSSVFADTATMTIHAGSGGHGCISFLREKYISAGPANGGDGGTGGNVYISAVPALKSLHKLARRREVKAGNGRNGMGKSRGGQRGDDVVLEVPVGTVVTEIERWDPVEEAEREYEEEEERAFREKREAKREEKRKRYRALIGQTELEEEEVRSWESDEDVHGRKDDLTASSDKFIGKRRPDMVGFGADAEYEKDHNGNVIHSRPAIDADQRGRWRRDRWLLQPSSLPSEYATTDFPALPRPRKSNIAAMQPPAPIRLDLSEPTQRPVLLAAGAVGGLGNPHFVTKSIARPKFATKGNVGMKIKLHFELKLLADLGFVGLPNAGKSTLLRALSNSRARVGSWAFTTLVPNLGTVILDNNTGRAKFEARDGEGKRLNGITVADIPGLIAGASQDRGLGLDFLRHVERARVLAFVVDLGAGDAVEALKGLWKELDAYENVREMAKHERSRAMVSWGALGTPLESADGKDGALATGDEPVMWKAQMHERSRSSVAAASPTISQKPWFVVATKADLENTQDNFASLQRYLTDVATGQAAHPAGQGSKNTHRWKTAHLKAIPVSAIHGHGVERVVECTADLLSG